MVERVAILGGTGKMGKWFARFFRDRGYEVVIGGRSPVRNKAVAREMGYGVEAAASTPYPNSWAAALFLRGDRPPMTTS